MTCAEFRRLLVEDDRPRAELRAHARDCHECADLLDAERRLHEEIASWRERTGAAPASLEGRILDAWARESDSTGEPVVRLRGRGAPGRFARSRGSRFAAGWLAAAAVVVVAVLATLALPRLREPEVVSVGGELLVADALAEARRAERDHARAIARLTESVRPILARAEDPATPPAEAALLRSYRDRLASLDDAIADVRRFLETNPGHPSARTVLLAAYMDKTELLGEILARNAEENA